MGSYTMCLCFKRRYRWSEAQPPPDVKKAFSTYCTSSDGQMTPDQLHRFIMEFQGEEGVTVSEAARVFEQVRQRRRHHHIGKLSRMHGIGIEDFFHYLFSEDLNPPLRSEVYHDMTAPLSHYYIYTGHNSYLTGNQLSSTCSDVPIINALKRGVRVIELDMWPNSTKDDDKFPWQAKSGQRYQVVGDGRNVLSVRGMYNVYYGFNLYENLSRLMMSVALGEQMLTQTFGELLYCPTTESLEEFSSPEALMKRIIVSTKPPKEYLESKSFKDEDNPSQKEKISSEEDSWGTELANNISKLYVDRKQEENRAQENCHDDELSGPYPDDGDYKVQQNSAPEYRRLIAIMAGKRKGGLNEQLRVDPHKVTRLSLNEQAFEKAVAAHGDDLVRFTQKNLLRIFPKATRVDSSNYNPLFGWMYGAQMVAFNMQGHGRSLWLMHGLFRANGGCGYVKKPDFLLKVGEHNQVFDPKAWLPVRKTLKRTRAIEDDWAPVWDEEFTFPLTVPELALLRIEVHEYDMSDKDDFGGQSCLPVSDLRTGIRTVPLFDRKGSKFKSVKLLMRFEFV
ncbi:Phosphoinositide phospholipase C 4 [Acorus calamus]|uniref:Phosphoinositide phospholipase C n=1 Tax=Acorus calamus TaxID=4465 RepID=A0AAV9C4U4_ACOCL|nr:Phosphoinositide phospholipase C 4 [Acorus calamus]